MENDEIKQLLTELLNAQRSFSAEYQRIASESLSIQREALELQKQALANQSKAIQEQAQSVRMQAQFGRLYRVTLVVSALVVMGLLAWLARLW